MLLKMADVNKRYFFYSPTAAEEIKKIERGMSAKDFQLPWVVVSGVRKNYTEMVASPENLRYKDSVHVAEGDIRRMSFSQLDD